MNTQLVAVNGSFPLQEGVLLAYPDPSVDVDITISLRGKTILPGQDGLGNLLTATPRSRKYITHRELEVLTAADADTISLLEDYFKGYNISVKSKNLLANDMVLTGSIKSFETCFHTEIGIREGINRHSYLSNLSPYYLPSFINEKISRVQSFSRPVKKEFRLPTKVKAPSPISQPVPGSPAENEPIETGYSVAELAKAYQFPADATGKGQVIGIIELGGKMNPSDYQKYFNERSLKVPEIIEVGIPPVTADPSTSLLNNAEVTLDLEVAGTIAPDAKLVVYYGNTIIEALKAILSDTANNPSVVSISWAGSEYNYTGDEVSEMNGLFYQAGLLGITIIAASADHGAFNNLSFPNVSLPASSPLVLGCGGTTVSITGGQISSQVVWNELNGQVASGGGYSSIYPIPLYQSAAVAAYPYQKSAARGVPDVAADASTINGYQVVFNGQNTVIGGTSAATPFVAALIALLNEKLGYRLGFINSLLYGLAGTGAFSQITSGNNQMYTAAPYWNPCTGLGTPDGSVLFNLFKQLETAPS